MHSPWIRAWHRQDFCCPGPAVSAACSKNTLLENNATERVGRDTSRSQGRDPTGCSWLWSWWMWWMESHQSVKCTPSDCSCINFPPPAPEPSTGCGMESGLTDLWLAMATVIPSLRIRSPSKEEPHYQQKLLPLWSCWLILTKIYTQVTTGHPIHPLTHPA